MKYFKFLLLNLSQLVNTCSSAVHTYLLLAIIYLSLPFCNQPMWKETEYNSYWFYFGPHSLWPAVASCFRIKEFLLPCVCRVTSLTLSMLFQAQSSARNIQIVHKINVLIFNDIFNDKFIQGTQITLESTNIRDINMYN